MSSTVTLSVCEGERMFSARTGKVLGSLLAAMTIGSLLLMLMESEPPRVSPDDLAGARGILFHAPERLSTAWRRIVVHASPGGGDSLPSRCHFIVRSAPDAQGRWVEPTDLWRLQAAGHHIYVPDKNYNADSIGVCVMGDFSSAPPSRGQFQALLRLARELQRSCSISAESVFLRRQLHGQPALPGNAFPVGTFDRGLLRPESK